MLVTALLVCCGAANAAELGRGEARRIRPSEADLDRSRSEVIQKIAETRAGAEKLLELHEAERQRVAQEYERRKELYWQGLIARNDVLTAEYALIQAMRKVEEDKRWLAETEMAITELTLLDELLRLPRLKPGAFSETGKLLRFNGVGRWTLSDTVKIQRFFTDAFGRALPISAYGHTNTHERLRFDHRDAIDVALHPDSREGQSLLTFLRQTGIPFVAFRGAVPGAATGAHIHIGKPSPRL